MHAIAGEYISGKCITLSPFTRAANFYSLFLLAPEAAAGLNWKDNRAFFFSLYYLFNSFHRSIIFSILYIGRLSFQFFRLADYLFNSLDWVWRQIDRFSHSGAIQLANTNYFQPLLTCLLTIRCFSCKEVSMKTQKTQSECTLKTFRGCLESLVFGTLKRPNFFGPY